LESAFEGLGLPSRDCHTLRRGEEELIELNPLRNRCSHNWLLKARLRRGKAPKKNKPPLLRYDGRDLHNVEVIEDFTSEYGMIYCKLFLKYGE
jgi:hypothetical protein